MHLKSNKNSILLEKHATKAEEEYMKAPNNKIGFLPYLSEKGPAII